MMNEKPSFPTVRQILHVRRLVDLGFFGPATVARLTGIPLRDVFRIAKTLRENRHRPHKRFKPLELLMEKESA